ncbi:MULTISPECIES: methionine synthase [unclassified Minwuia]|jgi:5-methyltetrahydrofolate--homocysteine methyltransferase|uniref:methionine synthase n=1 Tax=unclassified Minwuia TaxID=2618799 RepID=UPI0024794C03|nr:MULTISPECIES: methionine synthase [unclassified Minwuia]
MSDLIEALKSDVLLCDGAMGSRVQAMGLDIEVDYGGQENCTEILNRTRPDIVREIHRGYVESGSDIIQTNTFGASPITLGEFDLTDEAFDLNQRAARLAREVVDEARQADGVRLYVLGSIGPGTKLPSLGHIAYDDLEAAYRLQADGLISGGVDGILIETCQDPLQIKAAVNGAKDARKAAGVDVPVIVQVTVETTGTMLVGADIAAAATILKAMSVDAIGLNCATGPKEMMEHVRFLSESVDVPITVQPNAGLPELIDGETVYPLRPDELAEWLRRFVSDFGVNLIGGCCGTTPEHIQALDRMLSDLGRNRRRPEPAPRTPEWTPSIASLFTQTPLRQENAVLAIGERCNANGSRKFRELQAAENYDACVAMGRDQEGEGSHAIDLCAAYVGRDEIADMTALLSRMRGSLTAPLVIDSTELPVLEHALKLYGGKAVINSFNFEDGEEPADARLTLARRFGAAMIALTIDEDGMAKRAEDKLRVAKRLHDVAVNRHGLPASDLIIDPLTFTICTGNEDDRKLGLWTLDAIEQISKELPDCQILLGLSNISFGLNAAARHVLNSVFLDHAMKRGLNAAILHASKIVPLHQIPEAEVKAAEDLIFDRRAEGYDPLEAFMELFQDRKVAKTVKQRAETVEEQLKDRIIDGDGQGLAEDLDTAMKTHPPLDIINNILLGGMKVVGELFGAGKMQLPFVLRSAEVMKAAVAHLEPHMEKIKGQEKGTIVLATVKGDVHDIGKNLVDIILTNNGYRVVNLGIKQPLNNIVDAAKAEKADAIGMSGLLVKSTVIMRENLQQMAAEGLDIPVILGGAALTRKYVEQDCLEAYGGQRVAYARDAFDGLKMMDLIGTGTFDDHVASASETRAARPSTRKAVGRPSEGVTRPVDFEEISLRRAELHQDHVPPKPPFWGGRRIDHVDPRALLPYLNETMLYQFQWGFRKAGRDREDYRKWAEREVRPIMHQMLARCREEKILTPKAAYGYWPAASERDDLVLFDPESEKEVARFSLPRQNREGGLCIADFYPEAETGRRDVIGLQLVTMGTRASDVAREWFAQDKYQDYLYLHGLSVEMAEAMAEMVHARIRSELGFGSEDATDPHALLKQGYRGSRYSFGYPACPNLEDQAAILDLVGASAIGVEVAEEGQLHPEQSTSAIVVLHPQAKYFSV